MTFNPVAEARKVLRESDESDPNIIAELVFEATPKRAIASAYRHLLRSAAREAIRSLRSTDLPGGHSRGDAHGVIAAGESNVRRFPNRSGRVAAIRGEWKRARYVVGSEWKMLADCTADDVLQLVAQRRDVAARNTAEADRLERLARLMKDAGAATVADLPDDAEVA